MLFSFFGFFFSTPLSHSSVSCQSCFVWVFSLLLLCSLHFYQSPTVFIKTIFALLILSFSSSFFPFFFLLEDSPICFSKMISWQRLYTCFSLARKFFWWSKKSIVQLVEESSLMRAIKRTKEHEKKITYKGSTQFTCANYEVLVM